jgi:hypothetical protein
MSSNQVGSFSQELVMTGSHGSLWVKGGDLHGRRNGGKEEVLYLDVEDLEVRTKIIKTP